MKRIKQHYTTSDEWWCELNVDYYIQGTCYFRNIRHKQNISRDIIDTADFRDMNLNMKAWRTKQRSPTAWDDLPTSRRFYVKTWKDNSKRKKQWYKN